MRFPVIALLLFSVFCSQVYAGPTPCTANDKYIGAITIEMNGVPTVYQVAMAYPAQNNVAKGDSIIIDSGSRWYLTQNCDSKYGPNTMTAFNFLGKKFEFTVNLANVGCGCNAALYAVMMPGYDNNNNPAPSGTGDYYCDANQVGGYWCPEMDLFEANSHSVAITPHTCQDLSAGNKYWPYCDKGGCGMNTKYMGNNLYGTGSQFTIDTTKPFRVSTSFNVTDQQLTAIVTTISQEGRQIVINNDGRSCSGGQSYIKKMGEQIVDGMVITGALWQGDMTWLDSPPCPNPSPSCSLNNLNLVYSDLSFTDL